MNVLAVVMYRNPLEEWYWESGFGYRATLGLCAFAVLVLVFYAIAAWAERNK